MSALVGKHIEALHSTRTAFTKSECSDRIRRALKKKQIRQGGIQYHNGDRVYYKRPDSEKWKGPGVAIGQDGPVIFVRHGGTCVRVHQCRIMKTNLTEESGTSVENESVKNNVQVKLKQQMEDKGKVEDDDSSDDEDENLEQQNDGPVVDEQNNDSLNLKKGKLLSIRTYKTGRTV